ncbi:Holliday junction branch migration protein RuvA [bacterium]|nr:Holliday junction branch migration protein RuvA [bacterium]
MIAQIRGTVLGLDSDHAVLEAAGVGYAVYAPRSVLASLRVGQEAVLYTVYQFREDDVKLFGFASRAERNLFQTLRLVKGIGGKTALDLLSTLPAERICHAVATGNLALLCTAPGVGKKTAERIVFELRDKVKGEAGVAAPTAAGAGALGDDAVAGMMYFGYPPAVAAAAVAAARRSLGPAADTESLIREALKHV